MCNLHQLFLVVSTFNGYLSAGVGSLFQQSYCSSLNETFLKDFTFLHLPFPECPDERNELVYNLYNRDHSIEPMKLTLADDYVKEKESSCRFYFIVHGWMASAEDSKYIEIKNAFLKKENANVILVDWKDLAASQNYPLSASNTRSTGAHIAKMIGKIRSGGEVYIWCIGHSLGAHVCGHAGQRSKIDRITGIDPALPLFQDNYNKEIGINRKWATFVDIIHTNDIMGTYWALGHADFYVNGGRRQGGCSELDHSCHHSYGLDYMTYSINNACFKAKKCRSQFSFTSSCEECTECAQMGYSADANTHGIFYLETNAESPYCKAETTND